MNDINGRTGFGIGCAFELAVLFALFLVAGEDRFNACFDWALVFVPLSLVTRFVMHTAFDRRGWWDAVIGPSFLLLAIIIGIARPERLFGTDAESETAVVAAEAPGVAADSPVTPPAIPQVTIEEALGELDQLVGLEGVKAEVRRIINKVRVDNARKAQGLKVAPRTLHMVFTGNPGTGKTTVARIVAKIFRALGLLEKGQLVETDRSGLIAGYSGQTAQKTNRIIDSALGGVLFIDEAYQLVSSDSDDYGKEAVATLLKRMEDDRDRLIVIVAGYTDEMREFLSVNSGFRSRFGITLDFADFTAAELAQMFRANAEKAQYRLSPQLDSSLDALIAKLTSRRDRTFGNGRFVRQLFETAVARQADRVAEAGTLEGEALVTLEPSDLGVGEKKTDVRAPTVEEVLAELDGLVGMKPVKDEVRALIATVKANRLREEQGLEANRLTYNFVFTGNPGTGKTTVARIIAKAFRALGVLDRGHLVETDRSGLVAAYSGQTALKTNRLIDSAAGGILFIDEAYQLNQGEGDQYGAEAVATLLKRMEDERGRMVVIVAGYRDEMKRFMALNSGLESRFNRRLAFPDYTDGELAQMFRVTAAKAKYVLSRDTERYLDAYIGIMASERGRNFGNGRWVRNLFEKAVERQSIRIAGLEHPTREQLMTLTMHDVGIRLKDPDASQED